MSADETVGLCCGKTEAVKISDPPRAGRKREIPQSFCFFSIIHEEVWSLCRRAVTRFATLISASVFVSRFETFSPDHTQEQALIPNANMLVLIL